MLIGTCVKIALTKTWFEATAKAMMDAIWRLVGDGSVCCSFSDLIVGNHQSDTDGQTDGDSDAGDDVAINVDEHGLNPNQVRAVKSSDNPLALVWGPPGIVEPFRGTDGLDANRPSGTGKTTVVVKILYKFLKALDENEKILMTASTHNGLSLLCIRRPTSIPFI